MNNILKPLLALGIWAAFKGMKSSRKNGMNFMRMDDLLSSKRVRKMRKRLAKAIY
ncbi:hypothetical protein M1K46_12040 [Fictibacillus sp. WQ 8-8]|uniref:hypothetical protein n=1 Tax=unclassified Fictibacillus TaxID=2644029 RepID=UPI0008E224EC|nr:MULTISPECIES: hypothetical protein [unclassified Fictibacillus]MCQ6266386.1 hypothetical protein [Fictibacillus sp. WQ 8-8]MED2972393.1 hypothetical protein [Fictibacillus sp. B-59209]SFD63203.1 hypothetical protein SAMN05428981_1011188 [Bacillus sp. OV194]